MIKLFITDLDGCLSDGAYYRSSSGEVFKRFYSRDFHGLTMLHEHGIKVAVLSKSSGDWQAETIQHSLPFVEVILGVQDKKQKIFDTYVNTNIVEWSEIAYVGDDLIDIDLLKCVGMAACPADADEEVVKCVHNIDGDPVLNKDGSIFRKDGIVLKKNGGHGCIRELVKYLLRFSGKEKVV